MELYGLNFNRTLNCKSGQIPLQDDKNVVRKLVCALMSGMWESRLGRLRLYHDSVFPKVIKTFFT
jgi:hypothetical protein